MKIACLPGQCTIFVNCIQFSEQCPDNSCAFLFVGEVPLHPVKERILCIWAPHPFQMLFCQRIHKYLIPTEMNKWLSYPDLHTAFLLLFPNLQNSCFATILINFTFLRTSLLYLQILPEPTFSHWISITMCSHNNQVNSTPFSLLLFPCCFAIISLLIFNRS